MNVQSKENQDFVLPPVGVPGEIVEQKNMRSDTAARHFQTRSTSQTKQKYRFETETCPLALQSGGPDAYQIPSNIMYNQDDHEAAVMRVISQIGC